jgi:hypothetical protein
MRAKFQPKLSTKGKFFIHNNGTGEVFLTLLAFKRLAAKMRIWSGTKAGQSNQPFLSTRFFISLRFAMAEIVAYAKIKLLSNSKILKNND